MKTIQAIEDHLIGLSHTRSLDKVRNKYQLHERTASIFLQKCKPLETMRVAGLSSTIHDDVFNYALPTDYNSLIDLMPQDNRGTWDKAYRNKAGKFDLEKAIKNRTISIEGDLGAKLIRINWRSNTPITLNTMNSLTANGTWSAVGTATGLKAQELVKVSGSASIEFDVAATGDGIQNTTMTALDLTDEDEIAEAFYWVYLGSDYANLTSIGFVFGNDLTTNYWTATNQTTQADGSAFKYGWNQIKSPWTTATETGTVAPATIDSCKIVFNTTGTLSNVRIDNIVFSVGRNFDMKYYSKYLFKNSSGTYLSIPTSQEDYVLVDNDTLPIYLFEFLKGMAHQVEGVDSGFDLQFAEKELATLYPNFISEYPDQRKKTISNYSALPRINR